MAAAATAGTAARNSSGSGSGRSDAAGTGGSQPPPQSQPAAAPPEPPRKPRMDPRRRQAALSFLTNISLDGRPPRPQGAEWGGGDDKPAAGCACGSRTRHSLLAAAERGGGCSALSAVGTAALAASAPGFPQHSPLPPLLPGGVSSPLGAGRASGEPWQSARLSDGLGVFGPEESEEDDAFASVQVPAAAFSGSATPGSAAGSRGRLNSFTQGILPMGFSRPGSQNYCALEQPGPGSSAGAFEQLQRSR